MTAETYLTVCGLLIAASSLISVFVAIFSYFESRTIHDKYKSLEQEFKKLTADEKVNINELGKLYYESSRKGLISMLHHFYSSEEIPDTYKEFLNDVQSSMAEIDYTFGSYKSMIRYIEYTYKNKPKEFSKIFYAIVSSNRLENEEKKKLLEICHRLNGKLVSFR